MKFIAGLTMQSNAMSYQNSASPAAAQSWARLHSGIISTHVPQRITAINPHGNLALLW
jgi:hypothetical protein